MKEKDWNKFRKAASGNFDKPIISLIIDSPWIPTYHDINYLDYYLFPERWFDWNIELYEEFPSVVFIPGFWIEYGMVAEASGFGGRISWFEDGTPNIHSVIDDIDQVGEYKSPDPTHDGLMPLILRLYEHVAEKIKNSDHEIKMVAARGPLQIASWIRGMNEFMMDVKKKPEQAKELLRLTTDTTLAWLNAQIDTLSSVEGILLLDDVVGFLSPSDFHEFCYPYLNEIFDNFSDKIRVYHNDTDTSNIIEKLGKLDFEVFNFGYEVSPQNVAENIGEDKTLMGNIPPVDVLARGKPGEVKEEAKRLLNSFEGSSRLILSAGGGVAPNTPKENISALVNSWRSFVNVG